MKVYSSISELVGHTPLVQLQRFAAARGLKANLLAKVEYFNPAGSVKDRIACAMLDDAEQRGLLKPGVCAAISSALAMAPFMPCAPSVRTSCAP